MTAPIKTRKRLGAVLAALVLLLALLAAWVAWLNVRGESPLPASEPPLTRSPALLERGAYLARAGNCMGCHTARGGAPYAGGRGIETPFGTVFASNLTPDPDTGLGRWTPSEFWRALHHGRSRDGRLLYPAFPYPNYTRVTRDDADALLAYLQSLPPVRQASPPHRLRFPYNTQAALAVWRALFFRAAPFQPRDDRPAEWNRGAYLVEGLGHCAACHAPRNALGATRDAPGLSGGVIPMQGWYAPSLATAAEAGVAEWSTQDVVDLLGTGVSARGSVIGPMAEVVFRSTQHLDAADLQAVATYLRALPQQPVAAPAADEVERADSAVLARGERIYGQSCAQCHGEQGEGQPGAYPRLAGNRAVTMAEPTNLVQVIMHGGYLPATAGNPRPYGMPPFAQSLDDAEIAAVTTYLRQSWGNMAPGVLPLEVQRLR